MTGQLPWITCSGLPGRNGGSLPIEPLSFGGSPERQGRPLNPSPEDEAGTGSLVAWQEIVDALEMIAVLNLREPREKDTLYREVYERSSRVLKRLVEAGKYLRSLNKDRDFQRWRAELDCPYIG